MIQIESLYKYYGSARAVGPLAATIDQGEVVGLLGLNGAGKTTTQRILACDLLPSSGTVRVHGVDVVEDPAAVRALIGYLPEAPPLYEEMTVEAYLEFAAKLRRLPKTQVKGAVDSTMEATGLAERRQSPIRALSHGYRQRVGIAQAIVHRPKLVILDEPSSGLDPIQIKEMRALVRSLGKEHTVIVSSHNLPEISEMCDRLLVIGDGQIRASGTEEELIARWTRAAVVELQLMAPDPAETVRQWLLGLSGVDQVELGEWAGATRDSLNFLVTSSADLRASLAEHVVQKGYKLLGLARRDRELESVFAQLVLGKGRGAA